jgi:hypothetical protein
LLRNLKQPLPSYKEDYVPIKVTPVPIPPNPLHPSANPTSFVSIESNTPAVNATNTTPDGVAGHFTGTLQVTASTTVEGTLFVTFAKGLAMIVSGDAQFAGTVSAKDVLVTGADCAEEFDLQGSGGVEPGTVMVLDEMGMLEPSRQVYDKKVAGVVSGAGDYQPGLILDRRDTPQKRAALALVGKVFCKVDAQYAPVEVGDLLTTSPTLGHAMKATDPMRAFGSVIGKALRPLPAGTALIPVLVALQ